MRNTAEKKLVQLPLHFRDGAGETPQEPVTLFRIRETVVRYKTLAKVREPIKTAEDIAALFRKLAPNNVQEHVCLFCLDGSHAVVNCSRVFTGTANTATLHPREIFQIAHITGAVAIIVAHNHPSGNLVESHQDRATTRRLKEAGEIMGIPLLDHVIVTDHGFQSAAAKGWL
jgi:DNA repair protein RadC